ncbi:hypothetical protein FHJ31_04125 [Pseudomonas sp. Fig-3]|nr:hypothetical protein FHJ31_04125 [Pseudomonas sp. Fig-3]
MGASLLAIAVLQSTSMLDVMASSRAGSLPQGSRCFLGQLSHSPKWAFFLQRGAGILGRPFPWCRPPLCFAF